MPSPKDLVRDWVDAFNRADARAHIVNGLIVHQRGYWDQLSFLRQQGLPIPEEGA